MGTPLLTIYLSFKDQSILEKYIVYALFLKSLWKYKKVVKTLRISLKISCFSFSFLLVFESQHGKNSDGQSEYISLLNDPISLTFINYVEKRYKRRHHPTANNCKRKRYLSLISWPFPTEIRNKQNCSQVREPSTY